jgi:hypothetical protein
MENNAMTMLYGALLCSPGMNETVKADLRISRKLVLLLVQVMESGLEQQKAEGSGLLAAMPQGSSEELMEVMKDCLGKAGLTDLSEKLKSMAKEKVK